MAEINYNNLYNQLSPMEQRYYDQQFSKNYVPGQENIMLSSQPAYEQMKAAYEAEQQIPESSIFDSIFGSASAAEMPQVPNLTYRNIDLPFDLTTGITNTKAALPFKTNVSEILNRYNVPNSGSQNLVNQLIAENQKKTNPFDPRNIQSIFPTNFPSNIRQDVPLQNLGIDTSYGIANEPDVKQVDSLTSKKKSNGIFDLLMSVVMPGYNFIKNMASKGQPYEQFTPGGTIKNGIYNIDGVNVPVSSFGGDFYNPNTGLNRFDRARNRFNETRSLKDLFGASRTLAEFNNARKILEVQKKSGYKSDFMDRPKSERNYTGPGGGDNTGGDIGAKGAADSFSNKSGMGRTGY